MNAEFDSAEKTRFSENGKENCMNKWKKARARVLAATGALTMSASLLTPAMTVAVFAVDENNEITADIYPKPQSVSYDADGKEGMQLPGELEVVIKGEKDAVWAAKLESVLEEKSISYTYAETASADKATLLISTDSADLPSEDEASLQALAEKEGYVLFTDNDRKENGEITLVAADKDGIWNGILSLEQILDQTSDGKMAEVLVADFPDIKMCGFVEGFYGNTWSFENRMSVIRQSSEFKINTYIYAPKDDPYHKDQWRELYPEAEAEQLRQLVDTCNENNVEFIWCAHPGNGYNYTTDDDYNILIAKIDQLYDLGVRRFGLSYDDLSGSSNGADQAALINRVGAYLKEKDPACGSMVTVGQRYTDGWGADWNSYLKPFLNGLNEDVVVMWTGKNTGGNCDADAFNGPKNRVGYEQELAMWFNYPVNDMAFGRILMGAVDNMDPELESLRGFFMNPMNQAQASKVAIYQGADYSWNIHDYQAQRSWKRAIEEVLPGHSEALLRYAENTSYHKYEDLAHDESVWMQPYFDELNDAIAGNTNLAQAVASLKAKFQEMIDDADELLAMEDALLLAELSEHLEAYKDLGQAGVAAMTGFEKAMALDLDGISAAKTLMNQEISSANSHSIDAMNRNGYHYQTQVEVGTRRIRPFLAQAADKIDIVLKNSLSSSVPTHLISSESSIEGSAELKAGNYQAFIAVSLPAGGYAGMAIEKAVKVRSISFSEELPAGCRLEYSLNGAEWSIWNAESGNVDAAYVRIVNEGKTTVSLNGTLTAEVVYKAVENPVASTNMGTYSYYRISNICDGDLSSKYYSSDGSSVGDYVQVDYGHAVPLHDVVIWYAGNPKGAAEGIDGFMSTKLEVSTDNVTWKQIGEIYSASNPDQYVSMTIDGGIRARLEWNAGGELARYVRFSATESYGNWVQVFEVETNKNAPEAGDDEVVLASTNTNGHFRNVYDGDITTSFDLDAPAEGDHLIYNLTSITSVKELLVLQDAAKISNAKVSVQSFDGTWQEIGTLDAAAKTIGLNALIKAVCLDFVPGTPVSIKEIVVRPTDELLEGAITSPSVEAVKANKTLLQLAVAEADRLDTEENLAGVNAMVVDYFHQMLDAAKAVLADESASQAAVNDAWKNLARAIQMLGFKTDKTALQALIAECSAIDLAAYEDDEAKAEFIAALENAIAVEADPAALNEESIASAIARLNAAKAALNLKETDTIDASLLEYLLGVTEALDLDQYVTAGKAELAAAQEHAREVIANPQSQEEVNACIDELGNAYLNMRRKADEDVLRQLKDFLNRTEGLPLDTFSDEEMAAIQAAILAAKEILSNPEPEHESSLTALDLVRTAEKIMNNAGSNDIKPAGNTAGKPGSTSGAASANAVQKSSSVKTAAAFDLQAVLAAGTAAAAGLLASIRRRRK